VEGILKLSWEGSKNSCKVTVKTFTNGITCDVAEVMSFSLTVNAFKGVIGIHTLRIQ
jgi:hypothetical protein